LIAFHLSGEFWRISPRVALMLIDRPSRAKIRHRANRLLDLYTFGRTVKIIEIDEIDPEPQSDASRARRT
jgi:hypothetical protein